MSNKDKALKLALEALCKMIPCDDVCDCTGQRAITAIKEALAQPEQEPAVIPPESSQEAADAIERMLAEYNYPANPANVARAAWRAARLYKAAQPAQEPLGYMNAGYVYEMQQGQLPYAFVYPKFGVGVSVALYTTPPQRPWVGLTDEEREEIENRPFSQNDWLWSYACAIEAKLKEKNTP